MIRVEQGRSVHSLRSVEMTGEREVEVRAAEVTASGERQQQRDAERDEAKSHVTAPA